MSIDGGVRFTIRAAKRPRSTVSTSCSAGRVVPSWARPEPAGRRSRTCSTVPGRTVGRSSSATCPPVDSASPPGAPPVPRPSLFHGSIADSLHWPVRLRRLTPVSRPKTGAGRSSGPSARLTPVGRGGTRLSGGQRPADRHRPRVPRQRVAGHPRRSHLPPRWRE
jgi:hypothetical protein